jgi:glycine betaine/proline transport system ATP-binding protein
MKDGAFDQVGTAAELIRNPATDYVREFTEDVPKAKVLCARDVMDPASVSASRSVRVDTKVELIVPMLLDDGDSIAVTENGEIIGHVDWAIVSAVLGG